MGFNTSAGDDDRHHPAIGKIAIGFPFGDIKGFAQSFHDPLHIRNLAFDHRIGAGDRSGTDQFEMFFAGQFSDQNAYLGGAEFDCTYDILITEHKFTIRCNIYLYILSGKYITFERLFKLRPEFSTNFVT